MRLAMFPRSDVLGHLEQNPVCSRNAREERLLAQQHGLYNRRWLICEKLSKLTGGPEPPRHPARSLQSLILERVHRPESKAEVPPSKVTSELPRNLPIDSRIVAAFVSRMGLQDQLASGRHDRNDDPSACVDQEYTFVV